MRSVEESDKIVVSLLINIRLLSFAFVTSPVLSLIPFAITNSKEWGLASFAIGTLSIVLCLKIFDRLRSTDKPSNLIRKGAIATILLNVLLGVVLLYASLFNLNSINLVKIYLFLQLFTGIPFALMNGVDAKLSGSVFRSIGALEQNEMSPNAEFRRCRAAGSTAASAIGALAWCIVILCHPTAPKQPGWYSIIFALNIVPALLLLRHLRRLNKWLQEHPIRKPQASRVTNTPPEEEKENHKTEMIESIISIGCLEGLLQFSQFYFSISAIKALFDNVPTYNLLLIAIPLMFYVVNGLEQIGALLFSRYYARTLCVKPTKRSESIKRRQYTSLLTLFIAASFFVLHLIAGYSFNWHSSLPVVVYGFFNIIKGFAGGLSEEWNESIAGHYPQHDEARFTTLSALFGRLYQIASIAGFILLNLLAKNDSWKALMNIDTWKASLTNMGNGQKETGAFIGTLTVFIFFLFGANILAYFWVGNSKRQGGSTLKILANAVVEREERTALFTQLLRVLFVVSLILSNLLSFKVVNFKELVFTHGSIFYIMLFVLINLITVFEGVEAGIKTVFLGMVSYVVVFISLLLSAKMGGHLLNDELLEVEQYDRLIGYEIAYLYLASFCAYIVSVVLNVGLFAVLSKHFEARWPVVLGAVVTFISQVIDTLIFIGLIFILQGYRSQRKMDFTSMVIGQFSMKFSVYLVMYFPLYYMIQACKQWIGLREKPAQQW